MDFLTFGFLVLIVLASGGIAVFADWLGRKLGRKRLTIFKLRPKTTAQLGTFTSGILISFITIGLVYGLSSDVRLWIQEGRRAIAEVVELQRDKKNLEADVRDLAGQERTLRERASRWQMLADRRKLLVAHQNAIIEKQKRQVTDLRTKAGSLQANLGRIQARYASVQGQLASAKNSLAVARMQLGSVRKTLVAAQTELKKTNATMVAAVSQHNELVRRNVELETDGARLEKTVGDLRTEIASLQAEQTQLERDALEAQRQYDQTRGQLLQVEMDLSRTSADLNRAKSQLAAAQDALGVSFMASRTKPLTFALGEELARLPIPANLNRDDALNAVRTLERAARSVALERGAEGRGADHPAAGIFPRDDSGSQRVFTTEDLENALAQKVAGQDGEQLLVAFSSLNAFRGEPVSLEIAVFPNPVVYKQSEVIAESKIDGKKDTAQIWEEIATFIGAKVRDSARNANMIAKRGATDSLGAVPASDLLKLVAKVKAMDRTIRLQALAENETKAGDPLRLDFRIR